MAPRKPEGIIDDLFEGSGKKITHAIRRQVQDAVHAEIRLAERQAKAALSASKSTIKTGKVVDKTKGKFAKEIGVKKGPDGKNVRVEGKIKTKNPAKRATKVTNKRDAAAARITDTQKRVPKKTAARADSYKKVAEKKLFTARAFFPDDATFSRAMKEEARDIRKATKNIKGGPKVKKK